MTRPRLTVRARLTLLYTGLFTLCGAIVVAVSYLLVEQLHPSEQGQQPSYDNLPATLAAVCRAEAASPHPNSATVAKCNEALRYQGALHQRQVTLSHLLQYSLITLIVVIALAGLLGWIFSGRTLRPVHRITRAARSASQHNLSDRVALHGPRDELRELAETFNEMLDRLQAAFDAQQRFIANASHELRTPLAVMRTTVDVVASNPDSTPGDLHTMAADVRTAVDHAEHLIKALLLLARNEAGLTVRQEVDLATVTQDALDTVALGDRLIHATLEPAVISGDPVLAEHLVINLVDNAVHYNTPGGEIWITTRATAETSELMIANTGPDMIPADAERIFQPFQRLANRTSHDGFGLGLTIVSSIAAVHGGMATAQPRRGGGLIVTVTIPSNGAAHSSQAVPTAAPRGRI